MSTLYHCLLLLPSFLELKKAIVLVKQAKVSATDMQILHKKLQQEIKFLSHHLVFYHNQHHAEALIIKKRNKVFLLLKNIEITRLSNKLDHIKIRLFKIIRNVKEISFELKLSESMQEKYSAFHVLLLKQVSSEVSILNKF